MISLFPTLYLIFNPSNPTFLQPTYSPVLIYFGRERVWWVICNNYPTVLKEKKRNRKSTACPICWLKSVIHEEIVGKKKIIMSDVRRYDFPVPDAFPHVVRTLANRQRRLYSFCFSLLKLWDNYK
jgi:hypothetical protein